MNSHGTWWTSLPVGWMDGVAVGFRGVGRKFTRPRLVKGRSPVKAYVKSYGTRPPTRLSKATCLGSVLGLAKSTRSSRRPKARLRTLPRHSRSHSGSTEPSARETSRAARFNARSKPGPVPCGRHRSAPPSRHARPDATAAPPAASQTRPGPKKKPLRLTRNEPYRDARRINKNERLRGRAVHLFG